MSEAITDVDFETFLQAEQASQVRHELVGGRVYLMAGGTERHDLATALLFQRLAPTALERGCRPFMANRLVRTKLGSAYYPDVMVACGKAPNRLFETDPTLVIEVLSPSTAERDRREKALAYAASSKLELLLLVEPDRRRIEAARPVGGRLHWSVHIPGGVIFTAYGDIDVEAFYDELEAVATTS